MRSVNTETVHHVTMAYNVPFKNKTFALFLMITLANLLCVHVGHEGWVILGFVCFF